MMTCYICGGLQATADRFCSASCRESFDATPEGISERAIADFKAEGERTSDRLSSLVGAWTASAYGDAKTWTSDIVDVYREAHILTFEIMASTLEF